MDRCHDMFGIPRDHAFPFCIPLEYPAVAYGLSKRRPTSETVPLDPWGPGALDQIALGIGEATGHVETRAAAGWFEGKGRATLPWGARA